MVFTAVLFPIPYSLFFHERLQDQRGGYLIDHLAMLLPRVACFVEDLVCLARCQPLVPQVDGQAGLSVGGRHCFWGWQRRDWVSSENSISGAWGTGCP